MLLDITGLKATGEGLGAVTAYWVGYINDDPYLMDQVDLQKDLVAVGSELNPLRKFKKYIENTLKNSKYSKNGDRGRKIFYNEKYRSVVIYDPNSKDLGTTFIPGNGKNYFDNFK